MTLPPGGLSKRYCRRSALVGSAGSYKRPLCDATNSHSRPEAAAGRFGWRSHKRSLGFGLVNVPINSKSLALPTAQID